MKNGGGGSQHISSLDLDDVRDMVEKARSDMKNIAELVIKGLGGAMKKVHLASSPPIDLPAQKQILTVREVEGLPRSTREFLK